MRLQRVWHPTVGPRADAHRSLAANVGLDSSELAAHRIGGVRRAVISDGHVFDRAVAAANVEKGHTEDWHDSRLVGVRIPQSHDAVDLTPGAAPRTEASIVIGRHSPARVAISRAVRIGVRRKSDDEVEAAIVVQADARVPDLASLLQPVRSDCNAFEVNPDQLASRAGPLRHWRRRRWRHRRWR